MNISVDEGRMVTHPSRPRRRLADMCKGLTPRKTGGKIDMGKPMGREVW